MRQICLFFLTQFASQNPKPNIEAMNRLYNFLEPRVYYFTTQSFYLNKMQKTHHCAELLDMVLI